MTTSRESCSWASLRKCWIDFRDGGQGGNSILNNLTMIASQLNSYYNVIGKDFLLPRRNYFDDTPVLLYYFAFIKNVRVTVFYYLLFYQICSNTTRAAFKWLAIIHRWGLFSSVNFRRFDRVVTLGKQLFDKNEFVLSVGRSTLHFDLKIFIS